MKIINSIETYSEVSNQILAMIQKEIDSNETLTDKERAELFSKLSAVRTKLHFTSIREDKWSELSNVTRIMEQSIPPLFKVHQIISIVDEIDLTKIPD